MPGPQLRGSGAGGGQYTSTDPKFSFGGWHPKSRPAVTAICAHRGSLLECAPPALLAEILLRQQLSRTFLDQCWGLEWVCVWGRAVRQTLPPALPSATPAPLSVQPDLQPQGEESADASLS